MNFLPHVVIIENIRKLQGKAQHHETLRDLESASVLYLKSSVLCVKLFALVTYPLLLLVNLFSRRSLSLEVGFVNIQLINQNDGKPNEASINSVETNIRPTCAFMTGSSDLVLS